MSNVTSWNPPQRAGEFYIVAQFCRDRGLVLWAAHDYREFLQRGGDYWLCDAYTKAQLFEANTLREIRTWLRMPNLTQSLKASATKGRP